MREPNAGGSRGLPGTVTLLVALFALALGFAAGDLLGPPLLAAFLAYLLLPYRGHPWVLRLLSIVAVVAVLWTVERFGGLLFILGLSLFLAYLLDPAVDRLGRTRVGRTPAVLILLVPVMGILVAAVILLVPPLAHQVGQLASSLPDLASRVQEKLMDLVESSRLRPWVERYEEFLPRLFQLVQRILTAAFGGVVDVTRAVGTAAAAVLLVPVLTFYLLRDYDRVRRRGTELVPRRYHPWLTETAREMDRLLGRWLRGVALVSLIIGVLTGVGLYLLGIPYALLLGALAGVLNFVPVVGFWITVAASAVTALASGGWPAVLQVGALLLALSVLEGQVLSPKIVGEAVGLHPVILLVAVGVFADLFGFLGALFAVPLSILLLILSRQLRALYLASDLYDDSAPPPSEPSDTGPSSGSAS